MFPLQDANQARNAPIINWMIIAANVLIFLYEMTLNRHELNEMIMMFGVVPAWLSADPGMHAITIFSSMFMHAGWIHLISNMWALHIFGDNVEDRLGHFNYMCFYLICGAVAALAQVFAGPNEMLPTIGASGAIGGVLGAYVVMFPHAKIITLIPIGLIPLFINVPAFVYLGLWFVSQAFAGVAALDHSKLAAEAAGQVAWWAHIGGFLAGLLLVKLMEKREYKQFYKDEFWPW